MPENQTRPSKPLVRSPSETGSDHLHVIAEEGYRVAARLGFPRNQGKLRGRRQRRVKATIVPSDADKGMSVERYPDSGHRSRLSKFILDVIAQNSSFVICVWHSHL